MGDVIGYLFLPPVEQYEGGHLGGQSRLGESLNLSVLSYSLLPID